MPDRAWVPPEEPPRAGHRRRYLENRFVQLVDPLPAHYGPLFAMTRSDAVVDRWQAGTQSSGYELFVQRFWDGVLAQFVFRAPDAAAIQGLVKCELANFRHQTAHLGVYSADGAQGTPLPIMAVGTFLDFLFSTYPLRKVYAEVPSFNFDQFASGEGRFFTIEGRLIDHEIHFGRLWDMYIISVSRKVWEAEIHPVVQRWRSS